MPALVRSHLAYWRNRSVPLVDGLPVEGTGDPETDALLAELQAQYMDLLQADLQHLDEADVAQAARVVRALARRLASRISRRYRQSRQARQLDIRRTIRTNITHGGAMVKLRYRRPRIANPRLVFIGDVPSRSPRSGSP
ncbi:MAG: VWA domain-containing protein [Clostridia bacterium]|nr:MAG: VWA domain-containing protein [Clostridia bacterium]